MPEKIWQRRFGREVFAIELRPLFSSVDEEYPVGLMEFFGLKRKNPASNVGEIHEKFMSVVFTLVGTTQGLAIGALAAKIPADTLAEFSRYSFYSAAHFLLCFMILARVTQTYICGALSYVQKIFSVFDLTAVLFVGVVQYWVIFSLSDDGKISSPFYGKIAFLAAIAMALHYYALRRLRSAENSRNLEKIQHINIGIAACVLALSVLSFVVEQNAVRVLSSLTMAMLLFINMHLSLEDTDFSQTAQGRLYKNPNDTPDLTGILDRSD